MLFTLWNGDQSCVAGSRFRDVFYLPEPFLLPHLKANRDFTSQYYSFKNLPGWSLACRLSWLETTLFLWRGFFSWVISQNWFRACIPQPIQSRTMKPKPSGRDLWTRQQLKVRTSSSGEVRGCLCVGGVNKISIELSCNRNSSSDHTHSAYLLLHHIACTWLL